MNSFNSLFLIASVNAGISISKVLYEDLSIYSFPTIKDSFKYFFNLRNNTIM